MHISQLSLKRLFHRAGIKRISNDSYEHVYNYMNSYLNDIGDKVYNLTKNRSNQTITSNDINNGYLLTNIIDIIKTQEGGNSDVYGFCHEQRSQCSNAIDSVLLPGATSIGKCGSQSGGYAPYCHGQPSQCNGVYDCNTPLVGGADKMNEDYYFSIPQTQFLRFIQGGNSDLNKKKITKSAFQQLQFFIENNTINYLMNKNKDLQKMNINEFTFNSN
jgi:histone H3/H4